MTENEEAVFDNHVENYFKSHRGAPDGRNFRAFCMRFDTKKDKEKYRKNFSSIFPNAPGSWINEDGGK